MSNIFEIHAGYGKAKCSIIKTDYGEVDIVMQRNPNCMRSGYPITPDLAHCMIDVLQSYLELNHQAPKGT